MNKMRRIAVLSVILCALSGLCMAQTANGLEVYADGTLAPIVVTGKANTKGEVVAIEATGNVTATGYVTAAAGFGYVPIGTIVAWYCWYSDSPLPEGWVKCNGQEIEATPKGSYLDNLDETKDDGKFKVPALNPTEKEKTGKFLRGGDKSGLVKQDQIKKHAHGLTKPGIGIYGIERQEKTLTSYSSCKLYKDWYHADEDGNDEVLLSQIIGQVSMEQTDVKKTYFGDQSVPVEIQNLQKTLLKSSGVVTYEDRLVLPAEYPLEVVTSTANTYDQKNDLNLTDNFHGTEGIGDETYPVNMSVIWIIRYK